MRFLNWLIKEFRPRLAPEGGIQALSEEAIKSLNKAEAKAKSGNKNAKDNVFMTEQNENQ